MACPTCDHTLAGLSDKWFHCDRCGTAVYDPDGENPDVYVPKLVERCRTFGATLGRAWSALWYQQGIAESINVPTERPKPYGSEQ
jgi:hypothetical protein